MIPLGLLKLVFSKTGAYILGALVVVGIGYGLWLSGWNAAMRVSQVASLRTENATLRQDLVDARAANAEAEKKGNELESARANAELQLQDLRKQLENSGRERLGPDGVRRLRNIR